eukprot:Opistho-2@70668
MREIETMVKLRHPNIVMFMGASTDVQRMCIVVEFMPGGTLMGIYEDAEVTLDWTARLSMLADACKGLEFLHSGNPPLLHRDVKSLNLLADDRLRIKVSDFGLALLSDKQKSSADITGSLLWIAPEILQDHDYTTKADVYSFGIVITELLNRQRPYLPPHHVTADSRTHRSTDGELAALILQVAHADLRPYMSETLPSRLRDLINKCLSRSVAERPEFTEISVVLGELRAECNAWPPPDN